MSELISRQQELDNKLESSNGVFVMFYSSWCIFSAMFLPTFEAYSDKSPENFCRVDIETLPGSADRYDIQYTPAVIFFKEGKADRRLDSLPHEGLDEIHLVNFINSVSAPAKA